MYGYYPSWRPWCKTIRIKDTEGGGGGNDHGKLRAIRNVGSFHAREGVQV